jgi:hypothetical protein
VTSSTRACAAVGFVSGGAAIAAAIVNNMKEKCMIGPRFGMGLQNSSQKFAFFAEVTAVPR